MCQVNSYAASAAHRVQAQGIVLQHILQVAAADAALQVPPQRHLQYHMTRINCAHFFLK